MFRLTLCFLLLAQFGYGQFTSLATNDDGSVLYFVTGLRQTGTTQPTHGKVFVADQNGLRPYAVVLQDPPELGPQGGITNLYNFFAVDVSGQGGIVAKSAIPYCTMQACKQDFSQTTLSGVAFPSPASFPSVLRLSANGRFAVQATQINYGNQPYTLSILDLSTGQPSSDQFVSSPSNPVQISSRGRVITNSGEAVFSVDGQVRLFSRAGVRAVTPPGVGARQGAVVSSDGAMAVYTVTTDQPRSSSLWLSDQRTSQQRMLVNNGYAPTISNDGRSVLFLSPERYDGATSDGTAQAFLISPETGVIQQVTQESRGIKEAILAGDGGSCYLVTQRGSLLRLDLVTGGSSVIVGRTPLIPAIIGIGSPGKLMQLLGTGLGEVSASASNGPLPTTLAGIRVLYEGRALPLQSVALQSDAPDSVWFQIPWDIPVSDKQGSVTLAIVTDAGTPTFVSDSTLLITEAAPELASASSPLTRSALGTTGEYSLVLAAHTDFSSLVTPEHPAEPGEIVHFYGRGFGRVTPPVAIGQPGPVNPLAEVVGGVTCVGAASQSPVDVLYAGLAPGFIGYYQLSVRLPAQLSGPTFLLQCAVGPSRTELYANLLVRQ